MNDHKTGHSDEHWAWLWYASSSGEINGIFITTPMKKTFSQPKFTIWIWISFSMQECQHFFAKQASCCQQQQHLPSLQRWQGPHGPAGWLGGGVQPPPTASPACAFTTITEQAATNRNKPQQAATRRFAAHGSTQTGRQTSAGQITTQQAATSRN